MDSNTLHEKYKKSEVNGLPFSFFKTNRDKLFKNIRSKFKSHTKNSVMVLQGASEQPRYDTDVNHCYFLQEANFYYLTVKYFMLI